MTDVVVKKPEPNSADWVASIYAGWDPESPQEAPYSFGDLTVSVDEHSVFFEKLLEEVSFVNHELLKPLENIYEPESFPEVNNPIEESLIVIDPELQNDTGLFPKSALWQSGWKSASGYMIVREQVYKRLLKAASQLREISPKLCLCVTDGWRSNDQQKELYDMFYPTGHVEGEPLYISPPSYDDALSAPHPSGGAVDVLIGIDGNALQLGSDLDYMDFESNTDYFESHEVQGKLYRDTRRLLVNLMRKNDFVVIDSEWWHFEYGTRRWAKIRGKEPLYGNAVVDITTYQGTKVVETVNRSKRSKIIREAASK